MGKMQFYAISAVIVLLVAIPLVRITSENLKKSYAEGCRAVFSLPAPDEMNTEDGFVIYCRVTNDGKRTVPKGKLVYLFDTAPSSGYIVDEVEGIKLPPGESQEIKLFILKERLHEGKQTIKIRISHFFPGFPSTPSATLDFFVKDGKIVPDVEADSVAPQEKQPGT